MISARVVMGPSYSDSDIQGAARCFGYVAPSIEVQTGDGVTGRIHNNNDETELDLQTGPGSTREGAARC